jgi:protein-S-isoprenylcysteine O-methyltransferase Ste14
LIFAYLIPTTLLDWAPQLDMVIGLTPFTPGIAGLVIGVLLAVNGFGFALWTISDQLFRARGTPIPVVATKVLLVSGPFKLCRNPMGFGAITAYLGLAILSRSPSSILFVVLFAGLFILYVKGFEEKELEARFGDSYRAYRASTAFIIPGLASPKKHG